MTILCTQFWTDFWPNFTSTILGLLFGLPIALWTNRIISNFQDRQNLKEKKQRLKSALQIIFQTITDNEARLAESTTVLNNGESQLDSKIDTSAWEAVKDDILDYLHDQNLKRKIAYHFSRLNTLNKLNNMHLELTVGVSSALQSASQTRAVFKINLLQTCQFLLLDGLEIKKMIQIVLNEK